MTSAPPLSRVLAAIASVAVLDGSFAFALCLRATPTCTLGRVFRGIATGLAGPAALQGGTAMTALGVGTHICVAAGWTLLYYLLYRRSAALRRWTATWAGVATASILTGAVVWLAMDLLIIPFTGARQTPFMSPAFLRILAGHPIVVGFPIVALVRDRGVLSAPRRGRNA